MSLRDEERKAVRQAIEGFHWYLDDGLSVKEAKGLALKETCMSEAIAYIKNY
jgi:hypothetical protein